MSLRTRLVLIVLGLTTLAFLLANAVGIALLRGELVKRVDAQFGKLEKASPALSAAARMLSSRKDLPADLVDVLGERLRDELRFYLYNADGTLQPVLSAGGQGPELGELRFGEPYTVPGSGGPSWRVHAVRLPDGGGALVIAQSLKQVEQTERSLIVINVVVPAAVLLLLGLVAATVVRLGLLPLTRMERTATRIAHGDFGRRMRQADPRTEPGRLGVAMNVMLDRLEEEIAARTESEARLRRFLADASHELRTPLTSVRGFAELHRRGGGEPDELMRRIEDEATRMGVLVNDLLTLAQLDEERPLDRAPVDLLEIAADTVRDARARLPARSVKLTGPLQPVTVPGDELRLRQIAANLVGNALTHTDAPVEVRVLHEGGFAVLEVADSGPGVAPEHVPHLFERLYRVSRGRSRAAGGAGLGLAIVAAIARAHGGTVGVDSEPGEGSRFRVLLPVVEAAPSSL
ncbi:ATP-binding protein [Nonomuraea sp. NPDC050663]|uniref:sensor histidine kinase n=1 Tax=Nonomuraea sp. NPDC050663 TaxID=3364370 RepID=UPI0037A48B03